MLRNYERSNLREFSKDENPEERKNTADEIRGIRAGYFQRQNALRTEMARLSSEGGINRDEFERFHGEIGDLQRDIEEKSETSINKLLNFYSIWQARKEIGSKKAELETIEKEYTELAELIRNIEDQIADREELERARQKLGEFYGDQSEKWREYRADEKNRDLAENAKEHDVVFVHGLHPNFVPGSNSMLQEGTPWETKLKIVLAFSPTLSASTIKKGDTPDNMWTETGVVLSRGRIQGAGVSGTTARGLYKKENAENSWEKDMKVAIRNAIVQRPSNNFNEFVVQKPEIAGLYIADEKRKVGVPNEVTHQQMVELAEKLGIPVYLIKQGEVYATTYDQDSQTLIPNDRLTTHQIYDQKPAVSESQKRELIQEILEDAPFEQSKLDLTDAYITDSRGYGAETYLRIKYLDQTRSFSGSPRILGVYPALGKKMELFSEEGRLYRREKLKYRTQYGQSRLEELGNYEMNSGCVRLNSHWIASYRDGEASKAISQPTDYLKLMQSQLEKTSANLKQGYYKFQENYLKSLAGHLYGFAEQARAFGDEEVATKAEEMAGSALPKEEYDRILASRIGPNGQFRITKADLGVRETGSESRSSKLRRILEEDYSPEKVLDFFSSEYGREYSSDVGVWEGYSLREHTLMVLRQYDKYFSSAELPTGLDKNFMRVLLALHDIGKPQAVKEGRKRDQHKFTLPVLQAELFRLGFSEREINIASALIEGDPIGDFVKGGDLGETRDEIRKVAEKCSLPPDQAYNLLKVYYMSDASSYTLDAGGKESLDSLFEFDPQHNKIDFSDRVKSRISDLKKSLH